jgi:hypothetical protein
MVGRSLFGTDWPIWSSGPEPHLRQSDLLTILRSYDVTVWGSAAWDNPKHLSYGTVRGVGDIGEAKYGALEFGGCADLAVASVIVTKYRTAAKLVRSVARRHR